MAGSVSCRNCGTVLDEDASINSETRKPCTVCGSTSRQYKLQVETLTIRSEVSAVALTIRPGAASILLQSVIIPGDKTKEGQLIEAVALPWFVIIELLNRDPSIAYQIKPRKWEEMVAGIYEPLWV